MMKPLRKRHLQVWTAWAVLMPVGIAFAWLAIPDSVPVKLLQSQTADLLPLIKKTSDKKDYTIHLRSNQENTHWQIEWKSKTVLAVPSAVIYKVKGSDYDITKSELIGRIEARGDYVFPLPPDSAGYSQLHLVLYDFIHQQVIDSINFQP